MSHKVAGPASVPDVMLRGLIFSLVAILASSLHAATRRAASEAERAKLLAESANEAKTRFLAMVSHELRTPLSPVLMIAETLENDPQMPDPFRADLGVIRRNVDIQLRLIDDLLDLARMGSGKLYLRLAPVDLHQPLQTALELCRPDMEARQIRPSLNCAASPLIVNADTIRLQQVFWNLLKNAIKFSAIGGNITVRIESHITQACVQITDTGVGISPDRLRSIFHPFEQGEAETGKRFGGLGLGLAICQALVEAHGGTIQATSEGLGHGATFTVMLPIGSGNLPSNTPHGATSHSLEVSDRESRS